MVNFVPPNASALALTRHGRGRRHRGGRHRRDAGRASSGIVSPLSGLLGGDAVAMAAVMVGASVAALLVLALATPAYHRDGAWAV